MSLSVQEFDFISSLVKDRSGISLSEDKMYLVESRLLPVARKAGLKDITELISSIKSSNDRALISEVTEAMTTNESSFFRDIKPFEQLRSIVLPRLFEKCPGKNHFRIWSAACSTGQEVYSLGMSLLEDPQCSGKTFEILGTDIASHVLEKAEQGVYSQFEVQRGLPIMMLVKYFTQQDESWVANDPLRQMVKFQNVNLIEDFSSLGKFDIVLCRNVLIYFETQTKLAVLNNISKQMEPHGILFLGVAEGIFGIEETFAPIPDATAIFHLK